MNLSGFAWCRQVSQTVVVALLLGFTGLGCRQVEPRMQPKQSEIPRPAPMVLGDSDYRLLWQELMNNASTALSQKNFAEAEQDCAEALKTISRFGQAGSCLTTNLVLQGEIYQAENKSDLAEQTFKEAIASREKAVGTNHPSMVMPLDKLANFYYFAERRYDLATPLCLRILQLVENISPRDDAEVEKRVLALAVVYRLQGRYAEAEHFYSRVLDLTKKTGGDFPGALVATAGFYHDWGKLDQAESLCQRALALQEQAAANTNSEAQMNLAITLYGVAENYRSWGRLAPAEALYRRSMEIVGKTDGPDNSDLLRPMAGLAATLAAQGQTNQAAALYQQAMVISQRNLEAEDPAVKAVLDDYTALLETMNQPGEAKFLRQAYQWQVLITRSQRARKVNALEAAEKLADEALDIAGNFGPTDTRLGKTQVQMAEILRQQGKTEQAEQAYTNAIASYEKAVGTNNPELIMPLESLADFYYITKVQYDQVASLYQRVLNILRADPAPNPLEIARWERNLADVYCLQGQKVLAEAGYKQAFATVESLTNATDDQVQYLQSLADFYQAGGRFAEAELPARRALAIRERTCGSDAGPDAQLGVAVCYDSLAQIYLAWNKPDQVELFYHQSLAIVEKVAGADSPDLAPRLMGLGAALRVQKKYAEAEVQYKRALTVMEKSLGSEALEVADVLDQYATLLADMNKPEDSKSMVEWANSIRKQNAARTN